MRRRDFVILLAGAIAGRPSTVRAQQKAMPVIGFLAIGGPDPGSSFEAAFRKGLSETGYVDGQNVRIEYRWAEGKPERFPALATELVTLNVDVIASAGGTLAALAAKRATTSIPIVLLGVGDPVAEGLVASLAHPGGNITGVVRFHSGTHRQAPGTAQAGCAGDQSDRLSPQARRRTLHGGRAEGSRSRGAGTGGGASSC